MKVFLIDMKTFAILSTHESEEAALAAKDSIPPPTHVCDEGFENLGNTDLARIYNALPGSSGVKRFADHESAVKRILKQIENPAAETAITSPAAEAIWDAPTPEERKVKKAKSKKTKPTTPSVAVVSVTAAGKKDNVRFVANSPRSKVFAAILKAEELGLDALVKKFTDMTRAQVMGCIQKLRAKQYVKVS